MNKTEFNETVYPHIRGRLSSDPSKHPSEQIVSDWHYCVENMSTDQAIAQVKEFFRTHEGRFTPKPNDFRKWHRREAMNNPQPKSGLARFDTEGIRTMPEMSIVKVTCSGFKGDNFRIGWIMRWKSQSDIAYLFERVGARWTTRCFVPNSIRGHDVRIEVLPGAAPESWYWWSSGGDAPEGIEDLLEGKPLSIFDPPF